MYMVFGIYHLSSINDKCNDYIGQPANIASVLYILEIFVSYMTKN